MKHQDLRVKIKAALRSQGFRIRGDKVLPHKGLDKPAIRALNEVAVQHRIDRSKPGLERHESRLLTRLASGDSIDPSAVRPRLVVVESDSDDELLFRYTALHWSIPVSSGYGRRLRFLVLDDQNDKLIGIIGLGDPVFALGARDEWIGWSPAQRSLRLRNVMDAFVLGAVPPYRELLCGKLMAMLTTCDEVRDEFHSKYGGKTSLIQATEGDARLALITTTSALGRSSVYNRVRFQNRLLFQRVGFTRGSGEFHFANGLYGAMHEFAKENCEPTAKKQEWGTGFRNRREVIKKCLQKLDLPDQWLYHGVQREIFVVPLAANTRQFLTGERERLHWHHQSAGALAAAFLSRWLIPRAARDTRYREFTPNQFRLWTR
jgi:hypothetical protein